MESLGNLFTGYVLERAASTPDGHRHGEECMLHLSQTGTDIETGATYHAYAAIIALFFALLGKGCGGETSAIPVTPPAGAPNQSLPESKSQSQTTLEQAFITQSIIIVYDRYGVRIGDIQAETAITLSSANIEHRTDGSAVFSGPLSEGTLENLGLNGPAYVYDIPEGWVE